MSNDILNIINQKLGDGVTRLPPVEGFRTNYPPSKPSNYNESDDSSDDESDDLDIDMDFLNPRNKFLTFNINTVLLAIILICVTYIIWQQRQLLRVKC